VRHATDTCPPELVAQVLRDRATGTARPAALSARRSQRDLIIASLIACPSPRPLGERHRARA